MSDNLDELLVRTGLLTPADLAVARTDAARTNRHLVETAIDLGLVHERRFAEWMAQMSRTPLVDSIPDDAAAALQHLITPATARELRVIPFRFADEQLFVAMVNALDGEALRVLEEMTGMKARAVTGVRSEIERVIDRLYPAALASPAPVEVEAPFDFSNETLLRRPPELDFLREAEPADDEFGTIMSMRRPPELDSLRDSAVAPEDDEFGTIIPPSRASEFDFGTLPPVTPAAAGEWTAESQPAGDESTAPTNPIIAIERRLDRIVRMIKGLEKRLDDLEGLIREQGASLRR